MKYEENASFNEVTLNGCIGRSNVMVNRNDSATAVDYKKFRAMNTELNGRLYGLSVRDGRFFIYSGPTRKVIYAGKIIGDGSILAGRIIDYDGPKMPNSQFNKCIEVGINPENVIDIRDLYNFYIALSQKRQKR